MSRRTGHNGKVDAPAKHTGPANRRRGKAGEVELCAFFADHLGISVKRNLGQTRDSGSDIPLGPFTIECKRRRRVGNLYEWLEQATAPGTRPIVALRADGKGWLVCMPISEFITLAREEIATIGRAA